MVRSYGYPPNRGPWFGSSQTIKTFHHSGVSKLTVSAFAKVKALGYQKLGRLQVWPSFVLEKYAFKILGFSGFLEPMETKRRHKGTSTSRATSWERAVTKDPMTTLITSLLYKIAKTIHRSSELADLIRSRPGKRQDCLFL